MMHIPMQKWTNEENDMEIPVLTPADYDRQVSSKVHYFHMRNWCWLDDTPHGRGGTTVAARLIPGSNVVKYAVANCSLKDNFCRKVGRNIAEMRLRSEKAKHNFKVVKDPTQWLNEFSEWVHFEYAGSELE